MRTRNLVAALVLCVSAAGCATQDATTRTTEEKQNAARKTAAQRTASSSEQAEQYLSQRFKGGPASIGIATDSFFGVCIIKASFVTLIDPDYPIYLRILSDNIFAPNGIEFAEAQYFSCVRDTDKMYTCTPHDPPPFPPYSHKYTIRIQNCGESDPWVVNY